MTKTLIRFPFVATEILTADVETILEAFFGRNPNNIKNQSMYSDYSSTTILEI